MSRPDGRLIAYEAIEEGFVDPKHFAECAIRWMTGDDVLEMMQANELWTGLEEDDEDEG